MALTTADELEMRALVARYADAVNRVNGDDWGATWAEKGAWDLMGHRVEGRASLVEFWKAAMGQFRFVYQLVQTGHVTHDDESAPRMRWYLTELGERADGARTLMVGVYHDTFVREAGAWLFAERRFNALYQGTPDLAGTVLPFPAID